MNKNHSLNIITKKELIFLSRKCLREKKASRSIYRKISRRHRSCRHLIKALQRSLFLSTSISDDIYQCLTKPIEYYQQLGKDPYLYIILRISQEIISTFA